MKKSDLADDDLASMAAYYEQLTLPACPECGSTDTAKTIGGIIRRTIEIAATTRRVKLVANRPEGKFHCNSCEKFFEAWIN